MKLCLILLLTWVGLAVELTTPVSLLPLLLLLAAHWLPGKTLLWWATGCGFCADVLSPGPLGREMLLCLMSAFFLHILKRRGVLKPITMQMALLGLFPWLYLTLSETLLVNATGQNLAVLSVMHTVSSTAGISSLMGVGCLVSRNFLMKTFRRKRRPVWG